MAPGDAGGEGITAGMIPDGVGGGGGEGRFNVAVDEFLPFVSGVVEDL